jgi:hypothetical protein
MGWAIWAGIGGVLAVLLLVSWRMDRAARRRGATVVRASAMGRARWQREIGTELKLNQVMTKGMSPRSADAARDIWDGKP